MMRKLFFLLLLSAAFVNAQEMEWKKIVPPLEFSFPRDHGSHPDYRTEWWYFTGQVQTREGRRFGYQFTIFRVGIQAGEKKADEPDMAPRQILAGHFAIADIQNNGFRFAERFRRIGAGFADAALDDMHAWIGDWELKRNGNGEVSISALDRETAIGVEFSLSPSKPLVFQENGGYSKKGSESGNASAYLSWTRMKTDGVLSFDGDEYPVSGASWFDHEWGSSQLGEGVQGWDWFGLHLDDGRDLMLYGLRNNDGEFIPESGGTLVDADGTAHPLTRDDFTMVPLQTWNSPITGANYPVRWEIAVPDKNISFQIQPMVDEAEMNAVSSLGVIYWEGPVEMIGKTTGRGYMELSGYATNLEDRF
ncbi:MAG: lipocalin-like domain-containing protein [Candidatus Hinthialibacter antarcticus]|nr:lipocalin-like domain-containing protein [Candidatus Hinthialibacter antarcticus]